MKASWGLFALIGMACLLAAVTPVWPGRVARPEAGIRLAAGVDERGLVLGRRMRAKGEVISRLLDGELTLAQAAEAFRYLNGAPEGMEDLSWKGRPGADDGERLCR